MIKDFLRRFFKEELLLEFRKGYDVGFARRETLNVLDLEIALKAARKEGFQEALRMYTADAVIETADREWLGATHGSTLTQQDVDKAHQDGFIEGLSAAGRSCPVEEPKPDHTFLNQLHGNDDRFPYEEAPKPVLRQYNFSDPTARNNPFTRYFPK